MALILFQSCIVFHCMDLPQFIQLVPYLWLFGLFPVFVITNNSAVKNLVHKSFYILGRISGIGISGSNVYCNYTQYINIYVILLGIIKFPSIGAVYTAFYILTGNMYHPCSLACQPSRWSNFWIFANQIIASFYHSAPRYMPRFHLLLEELS